jgi:hypothetical protein
VTVTRGSAEKTIQSGEAWWLRVVAGDANAMDSWRFGASEASVAAVASDVADLKSRDQGELAANANSSSTVSDLDGHRGIVATQSGGGSGAITIGAGVTDRVFYIRAPATNDMLFDVACGTSSFEIQPGQTWWIRVDGSEVFRVYNGSFYRAAQVSDVALLAIAYLNAMWSGELENLLTASDTAEARARLGVEIGEDVQAHSDRLALLSTAPVALTSGTIVNTDAGASTVFTLTLAHNATLASPTNAVAGLSYKWVIAQDGTGGRTLAFDAAFRFPGGTDPALSTAAGAVDVLVCLYDGTNWLCDLGGKAFA